MINDEIEKLQLDLDCEKFRLMSFQLENLLEDYNKLLELRENIQLKFFQAMDNIKKNEIPIDEDFTRWDETRTRERERWMWEINLIADLKYDIDDRPSFEEIIYYLEKVISFLDKRDFDFEDICKFVI